MGFFDKIKQSLTRTKEQFVERFEEVVKRADQPEQRSRPVDVETIEALEEALISADVGVAADGAHRRGRPREAQRGESRCAISSRRRSSPSSRAPMRPRRTVISRTS